MKIYNPLKQETYTADIALPGTTGRGLLGVPLFIDMHTHVRWPLFEGYDTLDRACIRGGFGICTIQPNTKPRIERASTLHIHRKEAEKYTVMFLHTSSVFGEETSAVAYSTDGIAYSPHELYYALKVKEPKLLMDHSQLYDIPGMFYQGGPVKPYRPLRGEAIAVFQTAMLALETGWHDVHIQHITSSYSVETVHYLKRYLHITSEITPHHLLLASEDISHVNMKINPPLAPERHRKTLVEMTKKGLIDILATDHAPHPPKVSDYTKAPYGSSHIEVAFSAFLTALRDIYLVVDKLTVAPAQRLGIALPPLRHNMVVIDPDAQYTVDSKAFVSRGKNTAFEGMRLRGKIVGVMIRGKWVYWDGSFLEV